MPTPNEVFQAAKRGDRVRHRNFPDAVFHIHDGALWIRLPNSNYDKPVKWDELMLDPDAWSIEEKCPHAEGSLDWAKWHVNRGLHVYHDCGAVKSEHDFNMGWRLSK